MQRINRGAIYYANLDPVVGSEQRGIRPVLVIQNNVGNRYSPTIVIAPISTKKNTNIPTHILIKNHYKIKKNSIIMLEQIRVIDKRRLKGYIATLDKKQLDDIDKAICISLGLSKKTC